MPSFKVLLTIKRKLREEAERRVATEEEVIIEVLSEMLDEPVNPNERAEIHLKLCEKYMGEAEEFLKKGDHAQASEKAWGAASQAVKALAIKRGKELRSHRELHEFVAKISEELKDKEIGRLWRSATSLDSVQISIFAHLPGTVKFYLSLLGSNSGHDARHRRPTGLILQALQTSQVLSFRETLFCDSIHCRIESKGCLRKVLSDIRFKGICENMGSQVLIFVQTIKEG
jgi:hypothetical protein